MTAGTAQANADADGDSAAHGEEERPALSPQRLSDADLSRLPPKRPSASSFGALSRSASLASLAEVLNGNDERHHAALLRSALAAFLRGAAVGGFVKGGLGLLGLLAKMRKGNAGGRLHGAGAEVTSALRYALFLGCFSSGFRLVEGALAATVKGSERWRAAVAGCVVAPTFLIAESAPSPGLALYVALRAALLALRSAKRKNAAFTSRLGAAVFEHGPVLSMCASASVLLHGWLLEPASLDKTYVRFLDRHGGKGRAVINALSEITMVGRAATTLPAVRAWYARHQPHACASLEPVTEACNHPCDLVHPGQGHLLHALRFAVLGVPAAIPVYVPVYAVSTALVQRGNLLRQPLRMLTRSTIGVLRSSAFLSSYCAIAWLSCCTVHNASSCVHGRKTPMSRATVMLCSLPAGLATLIEKPSRRTELALFCTSHALQSAARCALMWNWVRPVRRPDIALLMLSSSYIMHTYRQEPATFRSSFRNVFDWIFGYSWRRRGSVVSLIY